MAQIQETTFADSLSYRSARALIANNRALEGAANLVDEYPFLDGQTQLALVGAFIAGSKVNGRLIVEHLTADVPALLDFFRSDPNEAKMVADAIGRSTPLAAYLLANEGGKEIFDGLSSMGHSLPAPTEIAVAAKSSVWTEGVGLS